jgi:hypothetical protein
MKAQKVIIICLLCMVACVFSAKAQILSSKLINSYPSSVVIRVYDIVSKVQLSFDKQLQLAELLQSQDNLVAKAIANKTKTEEINQLRNQANSEILKVFSPEELNSIYGSIANVRAETNTSKQIAWYTKNYRLPVDAEKMLYPILYEKEKKIALIDCSFPINTKQKEIMLTQAYVAFDSAFNLFLTREGIINKESQIAELLRFKRSLKIRESQIDALLIFEEEAIRQFEKNENFDRDKYEREIIIKSINEEQFSDFLIFRNKESANLLAARYWSEIKQYGVAPAEDSIKFYPQIVSYNLEQWVANDRYKYDNRNRPRVIKEIRATKPLILSQLDMERKAIDQSKRESNDTKQTNATSKW